MTQDTKLARCPFCGGEAKLHHDDHSDYERQWTWFVGCKDWDNCGIEGSHEKERQAAIDWWNRRAESADLAALRQRVQELDEIRDAIGLCAAAVVLAYYRKTHDHILVDNDAIDAALKVEHWLGRR